MGGLFFDFEAVRTASRDRAASEPVIYAGSGKTYTMGEPLDMLSSSGDGVIARALQDVFERCRAA